MIERKGALRKEEEDKMQGCREGKKKDTEKGSKEM